MGVKFLSKTKYRILLSIILFLIVFMILGIPWTSWWFYGADDASGILLNYKTKSIKDLFYFFYEGNVGQLQAIGQSNCPHIYTRTSFLATYYRPLHCIFTTIQFWLFGTNGYGYLLTNIFFHAINTVILFNVFYSIVNYYPAMLAALTFAFHPQIAYRFNPISNFQYYINVTLVLCMLILFKKYLDTNKIYLYFLSILLFTLSLFMREVAIVLPVILFLGTCIYPVPIALNLKNFIAQLIQKLKITSGFWIAALGFLALRAYLYPFQMPAITNKLAFLPAIKKLILAKFPELQVFIYDLLGLSWLPYGHPIIRGVIVLLIFIFLIYLFVKNIQKIYVLYFLTCAMLMVWPGCIGNYSPRYFYEIHPYSLLATVFLFAYYPNKSQLFKKIGYVLLTLLVFFYTIFAFENFRIRNRKCKILSEAVIDLVKKTEIQQRAICFLSWPMEGFGGNPAPIFWVLLNDTNKQIYCDSSTALTQSDSNVVITTKWMNISSNFYDKNYVDIVPVPSGFRYISLNPQKVSFALDLIKNTDGSLGKKIINKKETINNQEVVTDFTLLIDEKWLKQNPVFIRWDYKIKKFEIIGIGKK